MIAMTKRLIEKGDLVWKTVAMGLLSICVYFLIQINDKVDYSYKFNVEQNMINQSTESRIITLEAQADRLGLNLAELREKFYTIQQR